jgi:hypothetical protein
VIGFNRQGGRGRVLDFDIENRPLSYWLPDRPTAEITAIASMWIGEPESMEVLLLGRETYEQILKRFVKRYNEADLVTGHYIRKHDLPIINGALIEMGLPTLQPKMTCDTKLDMVRKADIPATQEFLLDTLGVGVQKFHMSQTAWRQANRLSKKGLKATEERVSSDVFGHSEMRAEMLRRGLLGPPRLWKGI